MIATLSSLSNIRYAPQDFLDLKRRITEAGLMEPRLVYFGWKGVQVAALVSACVVLIILVDHPLLQVANAILLAFTYGQIGLLGHDAGHRQVSRKHPWLNDVVGHACGFLTALSSTWWSTQHNIHHAHPNREGSDPDIDIPILAYSEEQARTKTGLARFIVKYQGFLVFPIMMLTTVSLRTTSVRFITNEFREGRGRKVIIDLCLIVAHAAVYLWLLFTFLPPWTAVLFLFTHQLLWGLYMGMVFAPNHKGMPILGPDDKVDYLREQVLTSRNVRSHPVIDFWYGGLNFQIEHHLFPNMPRHNLRHAQPIVKSFCAERETPYHETGLLRSYWEISHHMYEVGQALRQSTNRIAST